MQIPIKTAIDRIPGGTMVVLWLAGSILTTFAPDMPKFLFFTASKRKLE
jgi:2-keto-3-deoxygluconate permease